MVTKIKKKRRFNYVWNLLLSLDQFGNAIAAGDADNTVSARVGFFANYGNGKFNWYWKPLEAIINFTFRPKDGKDHCLKAYFNDPGEHFRMGIHLIWYFVLEIIVLVSCILVLIPLIYLSALIAWLLKLLKIIKPKPAKSHDERIRDRINLIRLKSRGMNKEISYYNLTSNELSPEVIQFTKDLDTLIKNSGLF